MIMTRLLLHSNLNRKVIYLSKCIIQGKQDLSFYPPIKTKLKLAADLSFHIHLDIVSYIPEHTSTIINSILSFNL
jgi:hypothetical protein